MSKHFITITDENLYNDIVEYCRLNNEKVNNFCQRILKEQLLIEKYGDTPFTSYETTIIDSNPVSSITVDITIEKPNENESIEIVKNVKTNGGITQPSTVLVPYTIEENAPLITNGDSDLNKKYIKTRVPSNFYGEIKVEEPKKKKIRRL